MRKTMLPFSLFIVMVLVLLPHSVKGESCDYSYKNTLCEEASTAGPVIDEQQRDPFDDAHRRVSAAVLASAYWIDGFFSEERRVYEDTDTRLRLRFTNRTQEGDLLKISLRSSLRLDLPLYGERLRLFFSTDDDDRERFRLLTDEQASAEPAPDRRAATGLRYFLKSTIRNHASVSAGLRFRGGSPILFLEPRYRHSVKFEHWDFHFVQRFRAQSNGRLTAKTQFDLERPLNSNFFFRTSLTGAWYDDEDGYFYGHHLNLYQPLSSNRILRYRWSHSFATHPTGVLTESRLSASYRQRVWKDWMFVEVSPQAAFPRNEDYEFTPYLFVHVEVVFGHLKSLLR